MALVLDLLNRDPRPRHPEKANRPDQPVLRKPDWIRVKAPGSAQWAATNRIVKEHKLSTVCEEAGCPNIGECWEKKHATFMIMGDVCTRACAFCNVKTGLPGALDAGEPARVADAVAKLGLNHVVITSVDRDDLADGGAGHFAQVIARHSRRDAQDDDRGAHARLPAQGGRARARRRGEARCLQPQSRDGGLEISERSPGCALFPFAAPAATRKGARSEPVHQIGNHGRARRGAQRGAPAHGRSALRGCRFSHDRAISRALAQASPGDALRDAGGVQGLRDDRLHQGLRARLRNPADALLAPCGRGFREAEGGTPFATDIPDRCRWRIRKACRPSAPRAG